jgi:hypothetical protein
MVVKYHICADYFWGNRMKKNVGPYKNVIPTQFFSSTCEDYIWLCEQSLLYNKKNGEFLGVWWGSNSSIILQLLQNFINLVSRTTSSTQLCSVDVCRNASKRVQGTCISTGSKQERTIFLLHFRSNHWSSLSSSQLQSSCSNLNNTS